MSRAKQSRHADGEEKRPARRPSRTSLDRKIREQEKELSTLNESRRRKRAAAKDVYNAIGFDAMYRDGICQVEEGNGRTFSILHARRYCARRSCHCLRGPCDASETR